MRLLLSTAVTAAALSAAALEVTLPDSVPRKITSIRCEYRVAARRMAQGTITAYYQPPGKYRVQVPGGVVFLSDGNAAYRYSPRLRRAVRFPPGEPLFAPVNPAFLHLVIKASRREGREVISGKMCDVYVLASRIPYGKPGTRIWVWREGKVVLKTHYGSPDGGLSYICTRLEYNTRIPPSKFALPMGTVVRQYTAPPRPK